MNNREIIIAGAGLTGLTIAYYLKKAGFKIKVIEKDLRPGGVIRTQEENGFTYEMGPNTGVLGSPEAVSLFMELSDKCELIKARKASSKRYILKNGKWRALPSGILPGIVTPLFSFRDKLRITGEPFRRPGSDPQETVASLVRRRLGDTILGFAVDPFISGIYAGDPEMLVTKYALPKLYALEQNYGSFIKGAVAKARQPKSELEKKVTREIFSFRGGMEMLIRALTDNIGSENIITGAEALNSERKGNGFEIKFTSRSGNPERMNADIFIITSGANGIQSMIPFVPENELLPLTRIRYAPVVQVAAGYTKWEGMKLDAFGGLIPSSEQKELLGVLFPSSIFEERAPEGGALLSIFLGGIKKQEIYDYDDNKIKDIVIYEMEKLFNQKQQPDLLRIFRYPYAIPQYEGDSGERLLAISKIENKIKGLIIAGNVRDGIGIADRIRQGAEVASKIIANEW